MRGGNILQLARKSWVEWLLALLPFVLNSAFNHPTDDDFQGAVVARHLGFWEGIGFTTSTGRDATPAHFSTA